MHQPSRALRYLSAADVETLLPPVHERIALARRAMLALVADAELPPKLGVHPRARDSFAHVMPALLRGADESGSRDLVGMKWVVGFPDNRSRGLPAIHGTVLLNDPTTGVPLAMIDAGPITAHRTAAVSGLAIARWAPRERDVPLHVAMLGAGVQARSHLPVVGHLLPGSRLTVHDRNPERAEAIAAEAAAGLGFGEADTAPSAIDAIRDADVVLTLISFGPDRQSLPADAFRPDALVVAVDYDMSVPAALASEAALFVVEMAVVGGAVGGMLMSLFLLPGINYNEAFSSQHLEGFKNFVRLHIAGDGTLTLYPYGVDRPARWQFCPKAEPEAPYYVPTKAPEVRLIDGPVTLATPGFTASERGGSYAE